jgi:ATP-binding cassette subfamily B protein
MRGRTINLEEPQPVTPGVGRRVIAQFRPYRKQVTLVAILITTASVMGVLNPLLIQPMFNKGLFAPGGVNLKIVLEIGAVMALITIISGSIGLWQTYETTRVGQSVMRDLRSRLYAHLQGMPLSFFTATRTGEIQSRIANDVGGVQTVVTSTASSILANVVIFISSIVAMFLVSWELTVISLITLPFFFFLTKYVGERRRKVAAATQSTMAELSVITQETLGVSGILLSKVFGRQQREIARYEKENSNLAKLEVRQQMVGQSFFTTVQIFFSLTPVIVYVAAGVILHNGTTLTSGAIVAFTTLQSRLFFPIGQLLQVSVDLRTSLALFDRIYAYLDLKPSIVDKPDALAIAPADVRGEITFENVDFSYGADAAAAANKPLDEDDDAAPMKLQLHGVQLEVKPGQLAALVGPSGAGKTTIGYLVPRLYDVVGGAVKLDGHDVRDLTSDTIAAAVGSVTQESYLFHASIKDNLLYGRPDATEDQIVAAAKAAYIHDRVMEFPDGYDTIVGERGYRLSGGEKQRLAIARVLLHDPRVLILDEATSALDSESERMVQRALEDLMANRTTLAIAHRLSTIIAADVIYVIDGGTVVEQGTHAELLATGGVYARLYHEQYGDGEVEVVCEDGVIMRDGTVRLDDVFVAAR